MIRDVALAEVVAALEGPVSFTPERRGFKKRRGVPDSVFWLSPARKEFDCQPLPVLVELEGTFPNAAADFAKFADRYQDGTEYRYSIQFPIIGEKSTETKFERTRYDIIGIRANLLSSTPEIGEGTMHEEFTSWFDKFHSEIDTRALVKDHLPETVVEWHLQFTMFGHTFSTQVPFILSGPKEISNRTLERLSTPTIPSVVVVNNKYDSRDHTESYYTTAIDFPTMHPIRFRSA